MSSPHSTLAWTLQAALVCALATGCFVFDESLYKNREADAGGSTGDAGLPPLELADDCSGSITPISLSGRALSLALDTRSLRDDYTNANLPCVGTPSTGPDGFFAVQMRAGERWHFHARNRSGGDPVLYLLPSDCDARRCEARSAIDLCRTGSDEHLSVIAPADGVFYVGVDSGNAEGFTGSIEIYNPVCGDSTQTHGESCEPGVTTGVTCTTDCRATLSGSAMEVEVNDDAIMANELQLAMGATMSVGGRIAALCENDVYQVDLSTTGSITAVMRDVANVDCAAGSPAVMLQLLNSDGVVVRGSGTARGSNACPSIEAGDAFARNLAAGRYYLRVYAVTTEVRTFNYTLSVGLE